MADKMLVTQALDERDLLVKKIQDKIEKASFVDTVKPNEEKVLDARVSRDEFAKDAESAYQQIQDLIDRFQKIDAAIVASNAQTKITTSYGEFTVAGAISLRSRLRGCGSYDGDAIFFCTSSGSTSSVVFSRTYASTTSRGFSSFTLVSLPRIESLMLSAVD